MSQLQSFENLTKLPYFNQSGDTKCTNKKFSYVRQFLGEFYKRESDSINKNSAPRMN